MLNITRKEFIDNLKCTFLGFVLNAIWNFKFFILLLFRIRIIVAKTGYLYLFHLFLILIYIYDIRNYDIYFLGYIFYMQRDREIFSQIF